MDDWSFGIFGSIAEFERELIRARVRSGLAAAKARGIQLGRPALRKFSAADIRQLRRDRRTGMPFQKLAHLHGTSVWTAFQICKRRLKECSLLIYRGERSAYLPKTRCNKK